MKPILSSISKKIKSRLLPQNNSVRERQRFFVYMYSSLILFIGVPLNLLGLTGPSERFYFWMNVANLLVCLTVFALYFYKKISLKLALSLMLISSQLETSGEMLNCALNPSNYHMQLIVGNIVLSSVLIMLAVTAYIRRLPIILSFVCMGMYTACIVITRNEILINFYILFVLVFVAICILGEKLIQTTKALELENIHLKQDEAELLQFLRMNKQQVHAYIEFSKKKNPNSKEMEQLLDLLDESSQRNIINSVSNYLTEKQTTIDLIAAAFPELTPSEHEICRLVLQGKKLNDICEILNKTENNVTAHRGHIRKKLNLKPEDNLKKILELRMQCMMTGKPAN